MVEESEIERKRGNFSRKDGIVSRTWIVVSRSIPPMSNGRVCAAGLGHFHGKWHCMRHEVAFCHLCQTVTQG